MNRVSISVSLATGFVAYEPYATCYNALIPRSIYTSQENITAVKKDYQHQQKSSSALNLTTFTHVSTHNSTRITPQ